jgi:hypothetical protein
VRAANHLSPITGAEVRSGWRIRLREEAPAATPANGRGSFQDELHDDSARRTSQTPGDFCHPPQAAAADVGTFA